MKTYYRVEFVYVDGRWSILSIFKTLREAEDTINRTKKHLTHIQEYRIIKVTEEVIK